MRNFVAALVDGFGDHVRVLLVVDGLLVAAALLHYALVSPRPDAWLFAMSILRGAEAPGLSRWSIIANILIGNGLIWFTYSVLFVGVQAFFREWDRLRSR